MATHQGEGSVGGAEGSVGGAEGSVRGAEEQGSQAAGTGYMTPSPLAPQVLRFQSLQRREADPASRGDPNFHVQLALQAEIDNLREEVAKMKTSNSRSTPTRATGTNPFASPNPFSPGYESPINDGAHIDHRWNQSHWSMPATTREITPEKYDGKTSLEDYLMHFRQCWRRNRWSDVEAADTLASSLRGDAVRILHNLGNDISFQAIEQELQRRFGQEEQSKIYLLELRARRRRPHESLKDLAQAIRDLAGKAYPRIPREYREEITKEAFLEAVDDTDVRNAIFRSDTASLDDAVKAALEAEAFVKMERARRPMKYTRAMTSGTTEESVDAALTGQIQRTVDACLQPITAALDHLFQQQQQRRVVTCYGCGEPGHIKRVCPHQQSKNEDKPTRMAEGRLGDGKPTQTQATPPHH